MTRNWMCHGSGKVMIAESKRAMQSLIDMLDIVVPVVLGRPSDAVATTQACIRRHIECMESVLSDDPDAAFVDLSVESHAYLIFVRALEQLRGAVLNCPALKVKKASFSDESSAAKTEMQLSQNSDITELIKSIKQMNNVKSVLCDVVVKGRNYLFHGTDSHKTLALLQCTCAVASLIRFIYSYSSAPSIKVRTPDAAGINDTVPGSASPQTPATPAFGATGNVECGAVEACETSVLQLMARVGICDVKALLKEVVAEHAVMYVQSFFFLTADAVMFTLLQASRLPLLRLSNECP